jgi:hypothetical protein
VNSGQSVGKPAGIVESAVAVAMLRRSNLCYRSASAAVVHRGTAAGSTGRATHTQVHIKIPHIYPQDLRPDLVAAVNESLRMYESGLQVVGAYVRRGCVCACVAACRVPGIG